MLKGKKLQKIEYLENKKNFFNETKNIFFVFFEGISFGEKIKTTEAADPESYENMFVKNAGKLLEAMFFIESILELLQRIHFQSVWEVAQWFVCSNPTRQLTRLNDSTSL